MLSSKQQYEVLQSFSKPCSDYSVSTGSADFLELILDGLIVVVKHTHLIWKGILAGIVIATLICLILPALYTGRVEILQPHQSRSISSLVLGQLGPLAGLAGKDFGMSQSSPTDQYLAMLKSRSIATAIIQRFGLVQRYRDKSLQAAIEQLAKRSNITSAKDGTILIEVDDTDPKMAADLANAFADELDKFIQTFSVTEASQQRVFFEKQMRIAKDNLTTAELGLEETQKNTGMIQLDSQAKATIEANAKLRAMIAAKEVEIGTMRSFATNQNADLVRARKELDSLQVQLGKMESNKAFRIGDLQISSKKIPEAGLEYLRSLRDVKYYEAVFELLSKEYVSAKIDEARDTPTVQILDAAIPPEKRSHPNRVLIFSLSILLALALSVLYAFLLDRIRRAREIPEYAVRLDFLRKYGLSGFGQSSSRNNTENS